MRLKTLISLGPVGTVQFHPIPIQPGKNNVYHQVLFFLDTLDTSLPDLTRL